MTAITAVVGISWDQWMAASDIWHYDPSQILGVWVGYIPLEEVGFILMIPVVVGLWTAGLQNWMKSNGKGTAAVAGLVGLITLAGIILGRHELAPANAQPADYMIRLASWTLPVIVGQVILGRRVFLRQWQVWLVATLAPVIFFTFADAIALNGGVWVISPEKMLHVYLLGGVPLEEGLFFLTTTMMIIQGVLLFWDEAFRESVRDLINTLTTKYTKNTKVHGK